MSGWESKTETTTTLSTLTLDEDRRRLALDHAVDVFDPTKFHESGDSIDELLRVAKRIEAFLRGDS
jgi:hypothetical protein